MAIRIGPNLLDTRLFPPQTALLTETGSVLVGPVQGAGAASELWPLFLNMGKLIYMRRLGHAESDAVTAGFEEQYRQWMVAMVDQAVTGDAREYAHYMKLVQGVTPAINSMVNQLHAFSERVDKEVARLFEGQVTSDLYLRPGEPLDRRVQRVIDFMSEHEVTLEDSTGGFRDYLMHTFITPDGLPAIFPSSEEPDIPDEWITDEIIHL